jgi:hypothetical protein
MLLGILLNRSLEQHAHAHQWQVPTNHAGAVREVAGEITHQAQGPQRC